MDSDEIILVKFLSNDFKLCYIINSSEQPKRSILMLSKFLVHNTFIFNILFKLISRSVVQYIKKRPVENSIKYQYILLLIWKKCHSFELLNNNSYYFQC